MASQLGFASLSAPPGFRIVGATHRSQVPLGTVAPTSSVAIGLLVGSTVGSPIVGFFAAVADRLSGAPSILGVVTLIDGAVVANAVEVLVAVYAVSVSQGAVGGLKLSRGAPAVRGKENGRISRDTCRHAEDAGTTQSIGCDR